MVSIVEVTTRQQLRRFVDFPNQLYKDVPQFVPATYGDDLDDWDRKKNPAFSYCEARCWLALREGEIVGRIGAILSRKSNSKWGTNRLRFTQVDFIDDPEVSGALFETVENWARELGCTAVHGPLGFTDMDREGMLVEGFDRRGCFFTYYNHPYYMQHMAALGYVKDVDWVENLITAPQDEKAPAKAAHPAGAYTAGLFPAAQALFPAGKRGLCPPLRHRGPDPGADQKVQHEVRPPHQSPADLLRDE